MQADGNRSVLHSPRANMDREPDREVDAPKRERGRRRQAELPEISATDAELIAAMRRGEPAACTAFFVRYRPFLVGLALARKIPRRYWVTCVDETLNLTALRIMEGRPAPRDIASYLSTAMRNRVMNAKRGEKREESRLREAADAVVPGETRFISSVLSEAFLHSEEPFDAADRAQASQFVTELAHHLVATMSADDLELMRWVAERIPYSEIAEAFGVTVVAITKRVSRARRRLVSVALEYVARQPPAERHVLERFLDRGAQRTRAAMRESTAIRRVGEGA
jgi:RNA polymerase sigma factor (sigma-70 family)